MIPSAPDRSVPTYRDAARSTDARLADLLARMTLEEKIAQLGSYWIYELLEPHDFRTRLQGGIGHITRLLGASAMTATEGARVANQIQRYLVTETRLGIPALIHEECCSGYMGRGATCFPQAIGVASSFQPELAQAMADVVRVQMRAVGAHQGLSPVMDIARDPRWGRTEETYGEDPYLAAAMSVAFVRGLQGDDLRTGIVATGKHFVGYSMSEGGFNWAPPHLTPRELNEVYLFPFEAAVREGGIKSMMNAYNEMDGVPCAASHELLTQTLRESWGFDGVVVSDYFAVAQLHDFHNVARDKPAAAALAMNAGMDVELPNTDCFAEPLLDALQRGLVSMEAIDTSVTRLLRMKFDLGLFDAPYVDEERAIELFDNAEQRALAREIARQSIVLLKNEDNILPLRANVGRIAVLGPSADDVRNLVGDYAYPCHIETLIESVEKGTKFNQPMPVGLEKVDDFIPMRSFLEVLQTLMAERSAPTQLEYARGCGILDPDTRGIAEAVETAARADVALVFVGDRAGLTDNASSGEARDRAELDLPGVQNELVEAILATGTPTVVVLVNGRPAAIPGIVERAAAVVECWLPGEEGAEAVIEVLLGDANPGGKLPITVPRGVGQVPTYYGHKPSGGQSFWKGAYVDMSNRPLFPFGFGLSYTTFALDAFKVSREQARAGDHFDVDVRVTNSGDRAGDEVVQLYLRYQDTTITRPVLELKGFQRVHLAADESRTVRFTVAVNQMAFLDQRMQLVIEPGVLQVHLGTSSVDLPHTANVEIVGDTVEVTRAGAFFSTVTVE